MKYNTFIFDMDGVMIDSEPFWQMAQINTLHKEGVSVNCKDCEKHTKGRRIDDIAKIWCNLYNLDVLPIDLANKIINQVAVNITQNGQEIEGLTELLEYLKKQNYKIGLATSSSWKIINAVLNKLKIKDFFDEICSADDELYGKPNPAVYIKVLQKLKSTSEESIVLEDSVTGMIAAKSAMVFTMVLTKDVSNPKFSIANAKCNSLNSVINYLKRV